MKVAVLYGGHSMEREVSLKSGERIYNALLDLGHQAEKFDFSENTINELANYNPDLVYIALHGKSGEDGAVQEMLDIMGLKYTGPGPLACRLTFDKSITKEILQRNNLSTPDFYSLDASSFKDMGAAELLPLIIEKLGLPLIVKPSSQGSCLGVKLVAEDTNLAKSVIGALGYDSRVVIEKYIGGKEIAVSVLGGEILPIVEIVPPRDLFDFSAMYTVGETEYYVPARIEKAKVNKIKKIVSKAVKLFNTEDVCRIDFKISDDGTPYILELNTSPGMTQTSLLPMAAEADNEDFTNLVDRIIKISV